MTPTFAITFDDSTLLPDGHDFAFVVTLDAVHAFYRETAVCPELLEDSWAAMRCMRGEDESSAEPMRAGRDNPYLRAVI